MTCCFNFFTYSSYPILISQIIGEAIRISHPTHTHTCTLLLCFHSPSIRTTSNVCFCLLFRTFGVLTCIITYSLDNCVFNYIPIPVIASNVVLGISLSNCYLFSSLSFSLLSRMFLQTLFPCTRVCVLLWCPPQNYLFSAKT